MKYAYPVILYADGDKVGATVPDLPGCHTFGDDMADALLMAKDAMEIWLWSAEDDGLTIPTPSYNLTAEPHETLTLVAADTDEWRRSNDTRAVKKTLSVPSWLNAKAEKANAPFSRILQDGLKEYLHISK